MKTTANKGFAVGSTVALNEEYIALFESFDLRNVICEVVDVRRYPGGYAYTVAPVGEVSRVGNQARHVEVYASDIHPVWSGR